MALAVELCSSTGISPRISFSHDLRNTDGAVLIEQDPNRRSDLCLLDSTSDFVFSITNTFSQQQQQQLSSADELFSNGKIIPMKIKSPISNPPHQQQQQQQPPISTEKKKLKEFLSSSSDDEEKSSSKYFWKFKRSSSLNFDTIRSLHFLSRSNSTGSAPNPKQKHKLQKQSSVSGRRSSTSSSSSTSTSTYYFYTSSSSSSSHKSKNHGSCRNNNGVRISPVLNLPQAYIPKATVKFFGFGSLFCNGKIKTKKK